MNVLRKIYSVIGFISKWYAKIFSILIIILVVCITYDVVMRYLFNAPTIWSFSLSYMLGGSFIVAGLAYVYYQNDNIRIDLLYTRFPLKVKLWIDIIFTIIFTFPLLFMLTRQFGREALFSYSVQQKALETIWYPILWPFKTALVIGFGLVSIQSLTSFVRDIVTIIKGSQETW